MEKPFQWVMDRKKKKIVLGIFISVVIVAGIVFIPIGIDAAGPAPKFIEENWIELDKIANISKFNSAIGHGFPLPWDETSKKHYFRAFNSCGDSNEDVKVFAPTDAIITWIMDESHRLDNGEIRGKQLHLVSTTHPSIEFTLFHINIEKTNLRVFQRVKAGDELGFCDMRDECDTDIAVMRGGQSISWFELLSEDLREEYEDRGLKLEDVIKSEEEIRETKEDGYGFDNEDPDDWIQLSWINCTV